MKTGTLAAAIFCIQILFFSCSYEAAVQSADGNSLKAAAAEKESSVRWTQELEKSRLSRSIDSSESINRLLKLEPQTMIAFDAGIGLPFVYPQIDDFACIDTSDLNEGSAALIDNFCRALVSGDECDPFMKSGSVFSLALFLHDAEQCGFVFENARWIVGKAAVLENHFEIPVRFMQGNQKLDVCVFVEDVRFETENEPPDGSAGKYEILDLEIFNSGECGYQETQDKNFLE